MNDHDETQELCPHCQRIAEGLPKIMDSIRELLGNPELRLTLIMRNPRNTEGDAVMTDEDNMEAALAQATRFNEEVIKPSVAKTRLH